MWDSLGPQQSGQRTLRAGPSNQTTHPGIQAGLAGKYKTVYLGIVIISIGLTLGIIEGNHMPRWVQQVPVKHMATKEGQAGNTYPSPLNPSPELEHLTFMECPQGGQALEGGTNPREPPGRPKNNSHRSNLSLRHAPVGR